jgi:hypothetical protein
LLGRVLGQQRSIVATGAQLLSYLVMLVAGWLGWPAVFAAAVLVAAASEVALLTVKRPFGNRLERLRIGRVYRNLARDLATVLLLVATLDVAGTSLTMVLLAYAGIWAGSVGSGAFASSIDRRHPEHALTRNIDLADVRATGRPPSWVRRLAGDRLPFLSILMSGGAVAAALVGTLTPFVVTAAAALVASLAVAAILAVTWARSRAIPAGDVTVSAVRDWLATYRPQVALYFSGPAKDVYQVNMWLRPVEALDQAAVVLLRSQETFRSLAETDLPVVCVPGAVKFMNLDFGSLRVALYTANVGANIHMLREPGIKHVFVGHGDSDKQASVNPYSKVYDEVWVAGRAGRERYAEAGVGVRDENIVEIGRPQLAELDGRAAPANDGSFTVLYAPTWEGWLEDPYHTSLVLMGVSIVAQLLESSPPVRVIYKPHPLTGIRSGAARAAHGRIVELIKRAGGLIDAASLDGPAHRVVTGPTPGLLACFNRAHMLVSDVSSVVTDYVQTQRPYLVTNPSGQQEDDFRRSFPTARGGYLLSPDCGELEKVVDLVRAGQDPMWEARQELKAYILGPDDVNPLDRFRAAVTRLCR